MAYEKQTWTTGDVITQEKLNHMEDGIASTGNELLIRFVNGSTPSFSHSFSEMKEAYESGVFLVLVHEGRKVYGAPRNSGTIDGFQFNEFVPLSTEPSTNENPKLLALGMLRFEIDSSDNATVKMYSGVFNTTPTTPSQN